MRSPWATRVTVEPYLLCGRCEYCLHGNYALCVERRCYGVTLTCDQPPHLLGAYSQYMVLLPYSKLLAYGPEVEPREGCLSSVLGNGVRWVRTKGECSFGERAAKLMGDRPFDLVVEASGSTESYALAPHLLRSGGRLTCATVPGGDGLASLPMRQVVRKELVLRGGLGQSRDVEAAVDIINRKKYPMGEVITHVFPLAQANEAMGLLIDHPDRCVRAALDPWA